MSTKNTFFPDENFNFSNTQNLSLCIEVGFRYFTACVIDENSFELHYTEQIDFSALSDLNSSSKALSQNFEKVYISVLNSDFTLLPNAIFDQDNLADYLQLNLGELNNQRESYQSIPELNCTNAYRIESELIEFFESKYKHATFLHSSTTFLNLINTVKTQEESKLYLNVYDAHFLICYFKEGKLNLLNSFEFKTEADFIYLILFLSKELEMSQTKTEVILSGKINYQEALTEYFTSVSILDSKFIKGNSIPENNTHPFILPSFSFKCV